MELAADANTKRDIANIKETSLRGAEPAQLGSTFPHLATVKTTQKCHPFRADGP
ncbi:MAG: hypothetical protein IPN76_35015 [Saprospiraceae bacterium]|nr:hypothetical protein [Saprospiraceae bacterium]